MSLTHTNAPARDERGDDLRADAVAAAGHERGADPRSIVILDARSSRQTSITTGMTIGPAARALVDEPAERLAGVAAHGVEVGRALARRASAIDASTTCFASSMQILGLGRVHPARG